MTRCLDCGTRTKGSRCNGCADRRRGTTTERGYGWTHQQLRQQWAAVVASGRGVCSRCRQPIHRSEPWDLDHDDDRTRYLGPAHVRCNRKGPG